VRIAMIGTRGVPARYGGFETAVEEVGRRLAARGHEVTVYCRAFPGPGRARPEEYAGMRLVHLPAIRVRALETLSHTAVSVLHVLRRGDVDAVLVFNAANSVFLPLLRLRRLPTATHVDGLEWRRGKWGRGGRAYYRLAESLAVRWSDRLIADAKGIADYYRDEFGATSDEIAYGAPLLGDVGDDKLAAVGVHAGRYHLVVARIEPENHVDLIIMGYLRSRATLPLVIVGSAPYRSAHSEHVRRFAAGHPALRLLGGVWDQRQLDQLYANAATYIHGHSVGGTNPSLLRAMGAATATLAYDVSFNRDVLGPAGRFFADAESLARELERAEADPDTVTALGNELARRAATVYTWEEVTDGYERLCRELMKGHSQRGRVPGRRRPSSGWQRHP